MDTTVRDEEDGLPGNQRPQRPRSSVPSFLFISFMLFMLTSHNGDEFLARHQYQDALHSLTYQLSNYTSWINGTTSNYTVPERDPALTSILNSFNVQGSILDTTKSAYYSNVTGFIHGTSQFYNITPHHLEDNNASWTPSATTYMTDTNMTTLVERIGDWNWTASSKMSMSVVEKKPVGMDGISAENIALVHGRIELTNVNTTEDLRLEFEGIHFVSNGTIHGFAVPPGQHIDIRLLPSLVPDLVRNETAHIIRPELEARINKLKNMIDDGILDQESSNDELPQSTCPFTFHAHILPIPIPEYLMQEFEDELQNPTGIWTVKPPKMSINAIMISKECGILYEIKDTHGLRSKAFFRKVTTYAGTTGIIYLALLILFTRQSDRSRNPAGIYRVSRWTYLAQSTVDSVSFAGHVTFAILAEGRTSLSLIVPAFLACVLFVNEAQFAVLIHQIQGPENVNPRPQTTTPPPPPPPVQSANPPPSSTTPSPVTATNANNAPTQPVVQTTQTPSVNPPPSFFSFFIHHVRTDPQARLWFTLFIFLTFIVRVILSPVLSMVFVAITYSSIWLPQIIRSARRGRSSGLSKEYILGTTICRLYSALYFLYCPKNVLDVEPRWWAPLLALLVIVQAQVLILQELLGPTFFLPAKYASVKLYDYHPPMPLPDSEAPEQSLGDCAICMDAILVDSSIQQRSKSLDEKDNHDGRNGPRRTVGSTAGLLNAMQIGVGGTTLRKNYSLAPCHHLFHTECLEKWLAIKNICPQCRRPLPPL